MLVGLSQGYQVNMETFGAQNGANDGNGKAA